MANDATLFELGRNSLAMDNVRLAYKVLRAFMRRYPGTVAVLGSMDDARQTALMGLLHACEGWHPERGALSTYAYPVIWGYLTDAVKLSETLVKIPRHIRGERRRALHEQLHAETLDTSARAIPEPGDRPGPEDGLIAQEERQAMWRAVRRLAPRQRDAFRLYYRQGLQLQDIGARLGISAEGARLALHQAENAVAEQLGGRPVRIRHRPERRERVGARHG